MSTTGLLKHSKSATPLQRFHDKYTKDESGCWNWTDNTSKNGYGMLVVFGRQVRAHRFSYQQFIGDIPTGMIVCHKCDNKKCVNPDHLWVGTHEDNMSDMAVKGRGGNNNKKLSIDQVKEIKRLLPVSTMISLAERFRVKGPTIRRIRDGLSFKYV